PVGPRVEGDEDEPYGEVAGGEARGAARYRHGARCRGGDARHREHRPDDEEPIEGVVGLEAVGVERVTDPGPPHGHEERAVADEAERGGVAAEEVAERGAGHHEDEVEEDLEGRGMALLDGVVERTKARRDAEAPGRPPRTAETRDQGAGLDSSSSRRARARRPASSLAGRRKVSRRSQKKPCGVSG